MVSFDNDTARFNPTVSARDCVSGSAPYDTLRVSPEARKFGRIWLDANEGSACDDLGLERYPDPQNMSLKAGLSKWYGVEREQICVANGSSELIDLLIRAYCNPGNDAIAVCPPTFDIYAQRARLNGVGIKACLRNYDFMPDPAQIVSDIGSNVKLLFLCSPNNPSGSVVSRSTIEALAKLPHTLLVVDEAYVEYAETASCLELLNHHPNLLILRTLSKAWGAAALRVGVAIGHPDIIKALEALKNPFHISEVAADLALAVINNPEAMRQRVELTRCERERVRRALGANAEVEHVFPSQANFLLVKFKDSLRMMQQLLKHGIVVRDRAQLERCNGCLRISIATPAENDELIAALSGTSKNEEGRQESAPC